MIKKIIFFLALAGWIASLIIHIVSIADVDVMSMFPFILLLHLGVFVVWLPAILEMKANKELQTIQSKGIFSKFNPKYFYNSIFKNTPNFLKAIAIIGFIYAFINHIIALKTETGTVDIKEGQYILHNHGNFIRNITEQEYHHFKALNTRVFSAVWLVFYGMAMAILFPFKKKDDDALIN